MTDWTPLHHIIRIVCDYRNVTADDLKSGDRRREIVTPRFEVYWLAHRLTPLSLPQIGRALGGRDHTTVLNGVHRVENAMSEGGTYAAEMAELIALVELALAKNAGPDRADDVARARVIALKAINARHGTPAGSEADMRALAHAFLQSQRQLCEHRAFASTVTSVAQQLP